jgi:hypothetical protein
MKLKRIRIMGLCIVAALALSAIAASSASAGEYGQCVAKKKGSYADPNCQTLAKKGKGKFAWAPGPSPSCVAVKKGEWTDSGCTVKASKKGKGKFERVACFPNCAGYTSTTGEAKLVTALGTVKCVGSTDVGRITGPKSDLDTVSFFGCETKGAKCTSLRGAKAEGEIVTNELETTLIDHGEKGLSGLEPKAGEVWVQFSNAKLAHAPYLAEFGCAGVGFFRVKGSVSGVNTGNVNVMSKTSKQKFAPGVGEQDLLTDVCTTSAFTECPAKEIASTQEAEGTTEGTEASEVKA